eukprot:TRINITY_DN2199_c0_g1_i4.p1 TRINITY_DN2199_c0_g1~~TRINITY_DN2199_c0_g1_i4.p1  ORF type:complete len:421 (-),score=153.20 TRINITY_DN2199_c0_g1_i4:167-1429(-)
MHLKEEENIVNSISLNNEEEINDSIDSNREENENNVKMEKEEEEKKKEKEGFLSMNYFPLSIFERREDGEEEEKKCLSKENEDEFLLRSQFKFDRTIFYSEDARVFVFQVDNSMEDSSSSSFIHDSSSSSSIELESKGKEEEEGEGSEKRDELEKKERKGKEGKWKELEWEWVVFKEIVGESNQNFQYEMSIFEQVKEGKNIIPIIGWFPNGETNHVMIMPFIEDQPPINEKEIRDYMKQALESLVYLHSFGIMHRNLKRKNTLYCRKSRQFYLIDFGDATHWESGRWYHEAGNSKYLAPEQFGGRDYNPLVDIFSLGIIFAEFIFGVKHIVRFENRCEFIEGLEKWQSKSSRTYDDKDNWWVNWLWKQERERTNKKGDINPLQIYFLNQNVQDLLDQLTCTNPNHRITPQEALKHYYFR